MNLYRNGKFLETYNDSRELQLLIAYLAKHAEPRTVPSSPPPSVDTSVQAAPPSKDLNPQGTVLALNPTTFQQTVDEGKVFVKFFAPWYALPLHQT